MKYIKDNVTAARSAAGTHILTAGKGGNVRYRLN